MKTLRSPVREETTKPGPYLCQLRRSKGLISKVVMTCPAYTELLTLNLYILNENSLEQFSPNNPNVNHSISRSGFGCSLDSPIAPVFFLLPPPQSLKICILMFSILKHTFPIFLNAPSGWQIGWEPFSSGRLALNLIILRCDGLSWSLSGGCLPLASNIVADT